MNDWRHALKDRPVFVTGATGFIGRRLVDALVAAGARVTVLTRSARAAREFGAPVKTLTGALDGRRDLASDLRGQEILFHFAYDIRASMASNLSAFHRLIGAAADAGVGRIVHASSIVVYDGWPDRDLTEASAVTAAEGNPYRQAKIAMEQTLMDGPLPAAILQPTIVYGPGSSLWTDRFAAALARGTVFLPTPEGPCNGVFVDDVAQAALRAAILPDLGRERFIISGPEPFAWSALLRGYAELLGRGEVRHLPLAELSARLGPRPEPGRNEEAPPLAARVSAAARRAIGNRRFENLVATARRHLSRDSEMYPDHHLLDEMSGQGICRIGHAEQRLGYAPEFDLPKGLAATANHLRTLRL